MRYENKRYAESVEAAGAIPKFDSDWSRQMTEWLRSKQKCFDGAHEWVQWLSSSDVIEAVCQSWMDQDKADRPKAVLLDAVESVKDMLTDGISSIFYQSASRRIRDGVRRWKYGTMDERALSALNRTWKAIGIDTLTCGREYPEQVSMNAEEVRDAVSACGVGLGSYVEMYGGDQAAAKWLGQQSTKKQDELLEQAFPAGKYGL